MHERRRLLASTLLALGVIGVIAAGVPFVSSLSPSEQAKADRVLLVRFTDIPAGTFREAQWHTRRVLVSQAPQVFSMPYFDGAYRLPDNTWERPIVPCKQFRFSEGAFQCFDAALSNTWLAGPLWDSNGRSLKRELPDMQTVAYVVQGDSVMLGNDK